MSDQRLPVVHVPPRKEPEQEAPHNDRRAAREDAGQSGKGERKAISGIGIGEKKKPDAGTSGQTKNNQNVKAGYIWNADMSSYGVSAWTVGCSTMPLLGNFLGICCSKRLTDRISRL